MAKLQLSLANIADAGTLSGGLWLGTAPLANLQQRLLSKVARSVDLLATSTRLDIDLGTASTIVRFVGMARHNLTTAATYRITASTTLGGADLYDSTTLPVWPAVYLPEDLEWEDDNFWTGQLSNEEIVGYPSHGMHDARDQQQSPLLDHRDQRHRQPGRLCRTRPPANGHHLVPAAQLRPGRAAGLGGPHRLRHLPRRRALQRDAPSSPGTTPVAGGDQPRRSLRRLA